MTDTIETPAVEAPRLKATYADKVVPALQEQFGYGNAMPVPRVVKVVVNMGVGEAAHDSKMIEGAVRDLAAACAEALRARIGAAPGAVVLGYFGALNGRKRSDHFVRAVAEIRRALPGEDIHGAIFGRPERDCDPVERELQALAGSLGIADRIHLMGHVSPVEPSLAGVFALLVTARGERPIPQVMAEPPADPAAPTNRPSRSSRIMAVGWSRPSPITTAWPIAGCCSTSRSHAAGLMVLPLAVPTSVCVPLPLQVTA